MAFESVTTSSLKNALENCLNNINYRNELDIQGNLTDYIWATDSKNHLNQAIDKMVKNDYEKLKTRLKEGLQICSWIETYQQCQLKIKILEEQIDDLYNAENVRYSKIRALRKQIKEYEREMEQLRKQINELV